MRVILELVKMDGSGERRFYECAAGKLLRRDDTGRKVQARNSIGLALGCGAEVVVSVSLVEG